MNGNLHIYAAKHEPATRYNLGAPVGKPIWIRNAPHRLLPCARCRRWRWAAHLTVQVYYDGVRFSCAPGHGCKKPQIRRRRS